MSFAALSLEYKLSNVMQAKAFAAYLDKVGCFYTDRLVDYDSLPRDEQDKDTEPMNRMLRLITRYDGLRVYRY